MMNWSMSFETCTKLFFLTSSMSEDVAASEAPES